MEVNTTNARREIYKKAMMSGTSILIQSVNVLIVKTNILLEVKFSFGLKLKFNADYIHLSQQQQNIAILHISLYDPSLTKN